MIKPGVEAGSGSWAPVWAIIIITILIVGAQLVILREWSGSGGHGELETKFRVERSGLSIELQLHH